MGPVRRTVAVRHPKGPRPWRRGLRSWAGLALGGAAVLLGCDAGPTPEEGGGPPPVTVQVVTAEPVELPVTRSAVGSLRGPETTAVASEIAGTVVFFDIPEGQRVAQGHVLIRLDDAEARAGLTVARARHRNASLRLDRLRSLRAESVSSEQAHDDAVSEFETTRGELEEAETRLAKTVIRAPFAGVLGLRRVSLGQYLAPGQAIVELTQVDPLELVFDLPQRRAGEVAIGQRVLGLIGRCEARFQATVQAVDPQVDPITRTVRVEARVPNPDGTLFPGMAARIQLVVGSVPAAIVVPREAIVRIGTKHVVYVLNGDGQAAQREVELGEFFADGIHLRSGVAAGERVVVAGQQKLRPGAQTRVEPYEPTLNPTLALGRRPDENGCEFSR